MKGLLYRSWSRINIALVYAAQIIINYSKSKFFG